MRLEDGLADAVTGMLEVEFTPEDDVIGILEVELTLAEDDSCDVEVEFRLDEGDNRADDVIEAADVEFDVDGAAVIVELWVDEGTGASDGDGERDGFNDELTSFEDDACADGVAEVAFWVDDGKRSGEETGTRGGPEEL
jgi:hypothetical protein